MEAELLVGANTFWPTRLAATLKNLRLARRSERQERFSLHGLPSASRIEEYGGVQSTRTCARCEYYAKRPISRLPAPKINGFILSTRSAGLAKWRNPALPRVMRDLFTYQAEVTFSYRHRFPPVKKNSARLNSAFYFTILEGPGSGLGGLSVPSSAEFLLLREVGLVAFVFTEVNAKY